MLKQFKKGFTLAEVLIVIGIIGVVAALTLPNLNHATGDKETVTRVKKIYASLTDAFDRAEVIYGNYDTWFDDLATVEEKNLRFGKRVTEFMKISKDCGIQTGQGCFSSSNVKSFDGRDKGSSYDTTGIGGPACDYRVVTSDNISIAFSVSGNINVDIDGPNKGSNTVGKDIFAFKVVKDIGIMPYGYNLANVAMDSCMYANYRTTVGDCATAWVIENGNLDIYKVDYSTGKCNDSNIILDGTTNTSCH